ncbi:MAG: peptide ABC transporter substrate-binding protein [Candidatus Eremiobacteraeota bacterium]|nr:peptide ABC transporter substrate-binding protein [Candidatus Eremiobacteraeota bacterium]
MKHVAVVLFALVALAACSKTFQAGAGGRHPWTTPGVLRMGEPQEPDSLNLMYGHNAASDEASVLLFSFLLRFDDNGNYIPDLATAVPTLANGGISKDQRTITLHLRKDARWSDGQPLTADDWLFTYRAVNNPRNNTKTRYGWQDISSARAPDAHTLVIVLKKPSVAALGILTMGGAAYPPLPAHMLATLPDLNTAAFNSAPLSSGPFVLKAWNRGSSLIFEPNPYYFRGPAHLKQLIWKIIPDTNTLFSQLQTHEIDVYRGVDENQISRLAHIDGISIMHKTIANWRHLGINTSVEQLRDVRVRQAIAYGIDWKRINDTVYHGYNQLARSDVYPQSWAAPSLPPYTYDPIRARTLLAEAGWKLGKDGILHRGDLAMHLTISATSSAKTNEQSEVVMQSMLKTLGFDVAIRNYPSTMMFAQNGPLYTGKYDLEWSVDTNGPDPDNGGSWNSAFIPPKGANTSWLRDPVVDETSAAAADTFDQAIRKRLYQREEERLRDVVPAVYFYWETSYFGLNSDLHNFKPAAFLADAWNAWEWQI